jgi:solute carrier family 13 (sodium-dependent dicarboxylate transporter), member 2/3/5
MNSQHLFKSFFQSVILKQLPWIGLIAGLIGLVLPSLINPEGLSPEGVRALGIFLMAAIFWMTEPVPIYATSLLVILLQVFLLSDVGLFKMETSPVLPKYREFYAALANPIIILFLGGFSLASAAVKFGLDRNLTRLLLKPFGHKPANIILGLMLATALLSAFMSNTATTAMMMTVILPVVAVMDPKDPFRKALALSVPFAANLGGVATPIGTPPNAIALAALNQMGLRISFTTWMILAVPIVAVMLFVGWRILLILFPPASDRLILNLEGRFSRTPLALITYFVFGLTVLLWVTEKLHGIPASVVAFIPVAMLPALSVLDKKEIRNFPWEVLWLVAGGISIGASIKETGLADWMLTRIPLNSLGTTGAILAFGVLGYLVANLVSNTVTASILVPLVVGFSLTGNLGSSEIVQGVILVGVIVSFSMMLPISTPPNAIAMSSGLIQTGDMAKAGLLIGLVGIILVILCAFFYWPMIL